MRKFKLHNGAHGAALTVRVTPRARTTEFGGVLEDGTLRIRVQEPPIEGKANKALLSYLAKVLGIRKNQIQIVAGRKGLDKIISVDNMTAEEVEARLQGWLDS